MEQSLAWDRQPRTDFRRVALTGYAAIALLAGGFGDGAALAPLSGAVFTQGTIA
ncbi:HlyD family type I secretion periplasmic adaptor subunit, partial [Mesorhizobium sp. M1D.F.Ca.ET.183.01.1.1]